MAFNVTYRDHLTNVQLYGDLPPVTMKIQQRRMRLAGHCWRHKEEIASGLVLWKPPEGTRKRGRPKTSYVDNLLHDAEMDNTKELATLMEDRSTWKRIVAHVGRPGGRHR